MPRPELTHDAFLVLAAQAGFDPADPHLDSWPLASDRPPEYRVEHILAEHVLRGGTQYHVKWCNFDAPTWKPA